MSVLDAVRRWQRAQARILRDAYTAAWQAGAANYRSQRQPSGAERPPHAPPAPDPSAMSRALAPALTSLARMSVLMPLLAPTAEQIAQGGGYAGGMKLALQAFLRARAWTLQNGSSVVWAGEQAGYAEAAASEGLWFEWQLDPRAQEHCEDCPVLATFPPRPLDEWPTLPGDGGTACVTGCRCSLVAVLPPTETDRTLTGVQQAVLSKIALRKPVLGHA